jgi:hypothetical protein
VSGLDQCKYVCLCKFIQKQVVLSAESSWVELSNGEREWERTYLK